MNKLALALIATTFAAGSASMAFADDTTAPAAAATAPVATAPASTGGMMMSQDHQKGWHHKGPFSGLNLTEQQRQQIRDIMQTSHKGTTDTRQARQALHDIVVADNFDEAKAKSLIDTLTQAQSERMLQRAKAESKIVKLLTPEQRKIFDANYQKMQKKMAKHQDWQSESQQ